MLIVSSTNKHKNKQTICLFQESYWRIPNSMTPQQLTDAANSLRPTASSCVISGNDVVSMQQHHQQQQELGVGLSDSGEERGDNKPYHDDDDDDDDEEDDDYGVLRNRSRGRKGSAARNEALRQIAVSTSCKKRRVRVLPPQQTGPPKRPRLALRSEFLESEEGKEEEEEEEGAVAGRHEVKEAAAVGSRVSGGKKKSHAFLSDSESDDNPMEDALREPAAEESSSDDEHNLVINCEV